MLRHILHTAHGKIQDARNGAEVDETVGEFVRLPREDDGGVGLRRHDIADRRQRQVRSAIRREGSDLAESRAVVAQIL